MNPEDCIFFQLAKTSQRGLKYWTQIVSRLGVTAVQAMVINFLSQEDRITSHKLGSKTDLDSATLTGVLDRLEAGGFISRMPNPGDRRSILIILTEKGRDAAAEIRTLVEKANERFLAGLSDTDAASLRSLLAKIRMQDLRQESTV